MGGDASTAASQLVQLIRRGRLSQALGDVPDVVVCGKVGTKYVAQADSARFRAIGVGRTPREAAIKTLALHSELRKLVAARAEGGDAIAVRDGNGRRLTSVSPQEVMRWLSKSCPRN